MGGGNRVHRTARPPRSLPTVGMTSYFCVIFLSRGAAPSLAQETVDDPCPRVRLTPR
jgi:hypothetical protein